MRLKFLIIPSVVMCQVAAAQNGGAGFTQAQATVTAPVPAPATTPAAAASSTPVVPANPVSEPVAEPAIDRVAIMDYKSVYDAGTLEEEVKMAADRFGLTPSQQEVWMVAATDRRMAEKQAYEKLSSKADFDRESVYRNLRFAHNKFHETITGYLTPTQKHDLETDRLILQEKQRRIAKLPPPPPPPPTVTVAPVDSAAIKASEKKGKGKKSKRKKKAADQ